MDVRSAKRTAREWVQANVGEWPGLRAAHLVGGITTMPEDAPFPAHKDVDLHLIFDEGSSALQPTRPFANILEVSYRGLSFEAGVKPVGEYGSAEAVLSNPEVAHHLTVDSLLYDPTGLLGDLQGVVKEEYPRRQWILARIEFERRGHAGALGMLPMVSAAYGAAGELNILGYSMARLTAVLQVAALKAPKMGGRMFVRLRESLAEYDRLDLYEEALEILGLRYVEPEQVEQFLQEAAEGFDLAIEVKRTPTPFDHKLHRHLRPYFVDTCRGMLDEGNHRESLGWIVPYHLVTASIILTDGPESEKPVFAERQARFLTTVGMDDPQVRADKVARARRLADQIFDLAHEIAASHPGVVG